MIGNDLSARMFAREMARQVLERGALLQLLDSLPPPPPLTWRQRLAMRFFDYRERLVLAWRVLRGDDIHEDCGL